MGKNKRTKVHLHPGRILLFSYLFVISVGTALLALPQSRLVSIPIIDLVFTSAACTCVTGLTTVPVSYFTTFGKGVMLCLIQLGGVGLLTLSLFFISLFLNLGMATKMMAGEMFEFKWSRIKTFIITIVITTFAFESVGAVLFFSYFRKILPTKQAIFHSIFHSVSAFCNTGMSLLEEGITPFKDHPLFLLMTAFLVFTGGIGFVVWFEIGNKVKTYFKSRKETRQPPRFSLHTKLVLYTTAAIIFAGTILTWILEQGNTLKNVSFLDGIFATFFNTISLRSAGFELFDVSQLMPATLLLFLILMYIGGSPGSIAGGIKTTTFALFVATIATIVRNRDEVEFFGRKIPQEQIYKAISIIVLTATWILLSTLTLLITETGVTFFEAFFEVISAFSLCGLHTNTIVSFSVFGKILIILTMLLGRLGSLTLVFAFWKRKKKHLYRYPEEQIVIG